MTGAEREDAPAIEVPARYNAESDLKRTVAAGQNVFDFEIETK